MVVEQYSRHNELARSGNRNVDDKYAAEMIRIASVWHGKDGYILKIHDIPAWAYALDEVNDSIINAVCKATGGWGCPLCVCSLAGWTFKIGWGNEDGLRRHSLGGLLFWLGQRGGWVCLGREREVDSRPLTFREGCEHFP